MVDFKTSVEQCARDLAEAWTSLQVVSTSALPPKCYESWSKRASLHRQLSKTADLFVARELAWQLLNSILSPTSISSATDNTVTYNGIEMNFSIARHLALTSYVSVCWSIYDRIANVCGRLAGTSDIADNPKQNPKACEDFLGKKDTLGFGTHQYLQQAYKWPLKVAYKIRNWLVHEGYEEGGTDLFCGDKISDGFILSNNAASYIERLCDYNNDDDGKIQFCCLNSSEECWPTKNLLNILSKYHDELDIMFSDLIKWSVDAFTKQIITFSNRDRNQILSTVAVQVTP